MFECEIHGLPLIPGGGGAHDRVCQMCAVEEDVRRDLAAGRRPIVSAAHVQVGSLRRGDDGAPHWDWEVVR